MKAELFDILTDVEKGRITATVATTKVLDLFSVSGSIGDMIEDNRTRCPKCKSPNIDLPLRLTNWSNTGKAKCQECGNEFHDF